MEAKLSIPLAPLARQVLAGAPGWTESSTIDGQQSQIQVLSEDAGRCFF